MASAAPLFHSATGRDRYATLRASLAPHADLFRDADVLDFGASYALSMCALHELGARSVVGVEPEQWRVDEGLETLARLGHPPTLYCVEDTRHLPFADASFDVVLANAVFEHIPQPRDAYLREVWRVLRPGGHLIINETPNKYFPIDKHTTKLWFNHWLPSHVAKRRAYRRGRYSDNRIPWDYSGWRGMGYFEMVRPLTGCELIPETARVRHRLFARLGIPASILDPYPCWVLRKHHHPGSER